MIAGFTQVSNSSKTLPSKVTYICWKVGEKMLPRSLLKTHLLHGHCHVELVVTTRSPQLSFQADNLLCFGMAGEYLQFADIFSQSLIVGRFLL